MVGFNNLPLEVIVNIFNFLDVKDIKRAQLTCQQWLNAAHISREYSERIVFKFISINDTIRNLIRNSARKYKNVWLIYDKYNLDKSITNENELIEFFSIPNVRNNLKCLVFDFARCKIKINTLYTILSMLDNLIDLTFIDISFCFEEKTENVLQDLEKLLNHAELFANTTLKNLNSLAFKGYEILVIFSGIKNLINLDIKLSDYDQQFDSYVQQFFKNNEKTVKKLTLGLLGNSFVINNSFWGQLLLKTNMKLKEFHLDSRAADSWHLLIPNIVEFCRIQSSITKLSLESFYEINDNVMMNIVKSLPNLIELNISDTESLSDSTTVEILKLKNLKSLHFNRRSESNLQIKDLTNEVNYNLEELKGICLTDQACLQLSIKFPNLRILQFSCTDDGSDIGIQYIIKNCSNLIELEVRGNNITDFGFTGTHLKTKVKIGYSLPQLKKLISLEIPYSKITKEILLNGLIFKDLKKLYLYLDCKFSTNLNEFEIMTKNCPRIENLSLILDNFINDNLLKLIEIFITNLNEMESLYIASWFCHLESEHSRGLDMKFKRCSCKITLSCSCEDCIDILQLCKNLLINCKI